MKITTFAFVFAALFPSKWILASVMQTQNYSLIATSKLLHRSSTPFVSTGLPVGLEAQLRTDSIVRQAESNAQKMLAEKKQMQNAALRELEGWPKDISTEPCFATRIEVYGTNSDEIVTTVSSGCHASHGYQTSSIFLTEYCEKNMPVVFFTTVKILMPKEWESGKGKCFIEEGGYRDPTWKKYDENGRLIKWADASKFSEYIWITNQHSVISARLRSNWAMKHGMSVENAILRANDLINVFEWNGLNSKDLAEMRKKLNSNKK